MCESQELSLLIVSIFTRFIQMLIHALDSQKPRGLMQYQSLIGQRAKIEGFIVWVRWGPCHIIY